MITSVNIKNEWISHEMRIGAAKEGEKANTNASTMRGNCDEGCKCVSMSKCE